MATLVTGAAGFVGRNVVEWLLGDGHEVVAADLPPLADMDPPLDDRSATWHFGDLRNEGFVGSLFGPVPIHCVIHLATVTASGIDEIDDSAAMIEVNILSVERVVRAAARSGVARVVYVGSGSAYGRSWDGETALDEASSVSLPETLYGITKLAGESVALRMGALHGIDVRAVRLGSVFGPWERETPARHAMSIYLQIGRLALFRQEVVLPRESYRRDWIYSRDVARGLVALSRAERLRSPMYHLTSGIDWRAGPVNWCEALASAVPGFSFRVAETGEKSNVHDSANHDRAPMRIERLREDAGFVARFGPQSAARAYAEWLLAHPT